MIPIKREQFDSVLKACEKIKSESQSPHVILMLDLCYQQLKQHATTGCAYGLPFPVGTRFEVFNNTVEMMDRALLLAKSGTKVMVLE
jgi:hypothetical protein